MKLFYLLFSIPIFTNIKTNSLRCNICNQYNIDLNDPYWYYWFEHECFDFQKRKKNQEQRELCYYFDTFLDIHHEDFWDQWVSCNCLSKQINSFKEEL